MISPNRSAVAARSLRRLSVTAQATRVAARSYSSLGKTSVLRDRVTAVNTAGQQRGLDQQWPFKGTCGFATEGKPSVLTPRARSPNTPTVH